MTGKPWTVTNLVRKLGRIRIEQLRPTSHLGVPQYSEAIVGEVQKNSFNTVAYEDWSGRGLVKPALKYANMSQNVLQLAEVAK